MLESIRQAILVAVHNKQKLAMFHYQVLVHAGELTNIDPVEFCNAVGVPHSYSAEFRKMLSLASVMQNSGTRITTN